MHKRSVKYRHIFFDLDHTIYDFEKSSRHTLLDLYRRHELPDRGISDPEAFHEVYKRINIGLWEKYKRGEMEKEFLNVERFHLSLNEFRVNDRELAESIAMDYIRESPLKPFLFPQVREALEYLKAKYALHIITNGFEEVQESKLKANDLGKYFRSVTTSEEAGVKKPFPEIFMFALKKAGAKPEESLMIGDDIEVDIKGAKAAGMDQVFFNYTGIEHDETVTYEVRSMEEIMDIL